MESRTILIATATQFLVMLGFSIVMPVGPDIALDLGLPVAKLGLLASSYALAGFAVGLGAVGLLDRLGRRTPLVVGLAMLGFATLGASIASSLPMLMIMRAIAGGCGGICTALLTAIIGDTVSAERRGQAYALVLGTGPLVSIIGLPIAIQLAAISSWRMPLWLLGCAAICLMIVARFALPPLTGHLADRVRDRRSLFKYLPRRPAFRTAMLSVFAMTFAFGLLTANNASLLLLNLHLPRAWLATFYMTCGGTTFLLLRLVGRVSDRHGPFTLIGPAVSSFCVGVFFSYIYPPGSLVGLGAMFVTIMSISTLSVSLMTLALKAPEPSERAGFGALVGAFQNLASAAGAGMSSSLLTDLPGQRLGNAHLVGLLAIASAGIVPVLSRQLRVQLNRSVRTGPMLAARQSDKPII